MTEQKFLDIEGVAAYTHLAKSTIYKKVSRDEIPYIKLGTRTLFDKEQMLPESKYAVISVIKDVSISENSDA